MSEQQESRHRRLEGKSGLFAILTTIVIFIGGVIEIIPILSTPGATTAETFGVEPYSPLELAGRDIYVREGCYNCHSQMVRPMRSDTIRFGDWSRSYEVVYDRPFQFGSRRIGPDLHRVGTRYNDTWHYEHMRDPRSTSPGSIMPVYTWLYDSKVDIDDVTASVEAMRSLGVPYTDEDVATIAASLETEGQAIADRLAQWNAAVEWDDEIVAMTAYLQALGRDRPLFNDLSGLALGEALYVEFNCQRCHGEAGVGGVENLNADPPTIVSLNDMAQRMHLSSAAEAHTIVSMLTSGTDLEARIEDPPFESYGEFLNKLAEMESMIQYGSVVLGESEDGPDPQDMPNLGYRLNQTRLEAMIAYLINLAEWEE